MTILSALLPLAASAEPAQPAGFVHLNEIDKTMRQNIRYAPAPTYLAVRRKVTKPPNAS